MVTQWGFAGDTLGMTAWEVEGSGNSLFGRTAVSEEKEQAIDAAVSALCQEAYDATKRMLTENRDLLDSLVERLLEKETIEGSELTELVQKFKPASAQPVTAL
jgi:cell division protease FtsH